MVDKSIIIAEVEADSYSHADLLAMEKAIVEAKRRALIKERGEKAAAREEAAKVAAALKAEKSAGKVEVASGLSKHNFEIGDMVEFLFNKEKVVGKVRKVNEKSIVVYFHKVYRGINDDVEQRIDMSKVVSNLSAADRASKAA